MSTNQDLITSEVIKAYSPDPRNPNEIWRRKVLKMKYPQIVAIYLRLKREGKIK